MKKYTGKEDFSQDIHKRSYDKRFVLSKKCIKDIYQYLYNKKSYPYYLKIVSDNELKSLLNFLKLKKDILNILKILKRLKENLEINNLLNIYNPEDILKYKEKMEVLKDYRFVYHKALPYYIYTYKNL